MNKQVPLWSLIVAVAVAVLFLCGFTGAIASKPEPEVQTKTVYKTKTVEKKVKGETKFEMPPECRTALVDASQNMADFNALVGQIGDAIVEYSETYSEAPLTAALEQQQVVIADMLSAFALVTACDPSIANDVEISE